MKALIIAALVAVAFAGCARKQVDLPKTVLPAKPESTAVPPERLTSAEVNNCLDADPGARNVCRKVEKNAEIAEDQQKFVNRLYRERDGK
jgi:hypothetical protein